MNKKIDIGKEIIQSLQEAVDYKRGHISEQDGVKIYTYEDKQPQDKQSS